MDDYGLNSDGTSLFDTGVNPSLYGYPTNGNGDIGSPSYSIPYDPNMPTFGIPGGGDTYNPVYDPSGGSSIPGGGDLGVPSDGGSGFNIGSVLRSLGITSGGSGGGGGMDIGRLLLAALGIGSGIYSANQTHRATDQMIQGLTNASNQATTILNGNKGAFQPYADLGAYAAHGLQQLPLTGIAGNFNSLGSGRGIKLGQLAGR